jgi:hypothetical protein
MEPEVVAKPPPNLIAEIVIPLGNLEAQHNDPGKRREKGKVSGEKRGKEKDEKKGTSNKNNR